MGVEDFVEAAGLVQVAVGGVLDALGCISEEVVGLT